MKTYYVDANVFLRFSLKDNKSQFNQAKGLFEKASKSELIVIAIPETVFEIMYVLTSVYKFNRTEIYDLVSSIVKADYIEVNNRELLIQALDIYVSIGVDIADSYLYCLANKNEAQVFTFDKDFKKMINL